MTTLAPLNIQKTAQAVGVLLRCERRQQMSKLRLLKLLYIADRESLQETGRPIIGRKVVAMDHGPLHSEVLDLINGRHFHEPEWSKFFFREGYRVELIQDPGVGDLSRYEIDKLQEIAQRYDDFSDWQVAHEVTHGFAEWKKNWREGTSAVIPFEDIIDAVGRSADAAAILSDVKTAAEFDRIFGA